MVFGRRRGTLCIILCVFGVTLPGAKCAKEDGNQSVLDGDPYAMYDAEFSNWLDSFQEFLAGPVTIELALFVRDTLESEYRDLVVFRSEDHADAEAVQDLMAASRRIRWPLDGGREVRVTIEKTAAARISVSQREDVEEVYIALAGFQERTSGDYLEFVNGSLKGWCDTRVGQWARENPEVSVFDVESGHAMNLLEWYDTNTRFHSAD